MIAAKPPRNEARRLEALRQYGVLDTPPESALNEITALAAQICDTPMATICFIDEDRQWFKARVGIKKSEMPRDISVCSHAVHQRSLFIVPDLSRDERFAGNPLVTGEPRIRFYAGAPLVTPSGFVLGTLCVMDREPRKLTPAQKSALHVLSRQVMAHLELNRHMQELVESESKFRLLAENITDVFWISSPKLEKIDYVSPGYERIWGRKAADLYANPNRWSDVILPEDRERVLEVFDTLIKNAPSISVEYRIARPDGSVRWVHDRGFQVRNASGKLVRLTGITADITKRKQAEIAMHRLAAIVESSDDAIIGKTLEGIITSWNPGAEAIFGYSAKEAVGKPMLMLFPPERAAEEVEILTRIGRGESVEHFETVRVRKDGRRINISVTLSPIVDDSGKIIGASKIARDITERAQSETALRESQATLASALSSMTDAVFISDSAGRFITFNDAFVSFHRFKTRDECGKKLSDFQAILEVLTPDGKLVPLDMWAVPRALRGESVTNAEYTLRRKDTGETWVGNYSFSPIRDKEGQIVGSVTIGRDVTERKRAEEALNLFRALIDRSNDAIEIIDPETGRFLDINEVAHSRLGYTREEMLSLGIPDIVISQGRPLSVEEAVGQVRKSGYRTFEGHHKRKNGTTFPVEASIQYIRLNRDYLVAVVRDVTERKRAERQIAEQASFLDKARDAILVRDLDSKILFWNQGAERVYGWTSEEVIGRDVRDLLHVNVKKFEEAHGLVLDLGQWYGELQYHTRSRGDITVEARWTLIRDDDGQPQSVLIINTDITEKKKIEAQFLRAQRMESIGTLAGGIAHDLNNILAPILMSIDILKDMSESEQALEILDTIDLSAKRGADIVRQVLSFARGLEGERIEIQPKHLLKDLEKIIKDTFPKDIKLRFTLPTDIHTIMGDPTQVHQILLNLAVNARDAMPNGGNLSVSAENCLLDEHYAATHLDARPGRYVMISVTDSGTGIEPELMDKIFEPFFTTKELSKGTGLGLSTVMAIVKSHGGVVNVYSEPSRGTTFKVYLPVMETLAEGFLARPEESGFPRGNGETILIVDDEDSILTITGQTLQAFGYQVIKATDGAEAIGIYAQRRDEIAVVLTDMMMPILDGPAMIIAMLRINPEIKIIAASGLNANIGATRIADAGIKYFLTKPYSAATLLRTLRAIIDEPPAPKAPPSAAY